MTRQRGFSMVELLCVVVIMGSLGMSATAGFVDLRRDARITKLRQLAVMMEDTAQLIRRYRMVSGATTTVSYKGMSLPTPSGSVWTGHPSQVVKDALDGYPGGEAMARLMGCLGPAGEPPYGYDTFQRCPSQPDAWFSVTNAGASGFYYYPFAESLDWADCRVVYWPPYLRDPWYSYPGPEEGEVLQGAFIYTSDC